MLGSFPCGKIPMTIRVVAGIHRGRRLKQSSGLGLRPTSAKVKEALFSIIANRLQDAKVLDLFAGTGALGLEALSRGAQEVVFVENQSTSLKVLRENIQTCSFTESSTIQAQDVQTFLHNRPAPFQDIPFDLVFADPPYEITDLTPLLQQLESCEKVASHGLVVIEHFKKTSLPDHIGLLRQTRQSRYGDTTLSFYQMTPPMEENPCA